MQGTFRLWVSIGLGLFSDLVSGYSCKSSAGADVDWFYALKMPNLQSGQDSDHGTDFIYVDSSMRSSQWVQSVESVENSKSNIGRTVSQIFLAKRRERDFFAVYNDEDANTNKTEFGRGHMKGVLVFDDFQGVWMIHSVPRFPATSSNSYSYPPTGKRYGQSFLCVTFPTHLLNDIGTQLQFGQPIVYDKQLPNSYTKLYPKLVAALDSKSSRLPKNAHTYYSVKQLNSVGGVPFVSFTKNTKFRKDLYKDLVANELNSSLYVETWLNGGADLPSECQDKNKVYNLRSVKPYTAHFNSSKDHSKWTVSKDADDSWVCVGDINRQLSQFHRGGGTMCQRNAAISTLFRQIAGDVECCPKTPSTGRRDQSTRQNDNCRVVE